MNMYLRKLARELTPEGFTVLAFHRELTNDELILKSGCTDHCLAAGYVTTDMNGGTAGPAEIHKEESVEKSLVSNFSSSSKVHDGSPTFAF